MSNRLHIFVGEFCAISNWKLQTDTGCGAHANKRSEAGTETTRALIDGRTAIQSDNEHLHYDRRTSQPNVQAGCGRCAFPHRPHSTGTAPAVVVALPRGESRQGEGGPPRCWYSWLTRSGRRGGKDKWWERKKAPPGGRTENQKVGGIAVSRLAPTEGWG